MRPFRFAIHLREHGWEPYILTIGTRGQSLTSREKELLADVTILTVNPPFDRTTRSESQLGAAKARQRGDAGLASGFVETLDRQFPIDTWLLLFAFRYPNLVRCVRDVNPHVLWATGDPWSGLVVGRWLSRAAGVPYVADFRDPWTLSAVRSEGLSTLTRAINRRSERRIVAAADLVMFQAERVEEAYRRHYAALRPATLTIRNSFDPHVFEDPIEISGPAPDPPSSSPEPRPLQLGFFGRFRTMSPATLIVNVLVELRRRHPGKANRVIVTSFGPLGVADALFAQEHGVASQFTAHEAVPLEQSLAVLRQFDLLLVSTETRRDHIIPAKLFEYLPAGRPILSLSHNPEVAEILERTGTGVQMQEPGAVADLLAAAVDAIDRGEPISIPFAPRPEEIMRHEAAVSTGKLARAFDRLVDQRSGALTS